MLNASQSIGAVEELFRDLSETRMRELGLEVLRNSASYRKQDGPWPLVVSPHTWFRDLLRLLASDVPIAAGNPTHLDINSMLAAAPYVPQRGHVLAHHEPVYRFWAWMEQAGFAIPIRHESQPDGRNVPHPIEWMVTTLGLARLDEDHPLQPGAMQRLWDQFGTDHEDSLARLEDAQTCFDHGLLRPAVVLLGLAFEELLTIAATRLGVAAKRSARDRLEALRNKIEGDKKGDARTAALNALNVANAIRDARNDAAHKASSTWTATDVDELLADGMRAYPKIASYAPSS